MKFTPKKESEVQQANLLPAGIYDFDIVEANDGVSTSGNDMIKLKLKVYDGNSSHRVIFDYLMHMESMAFKLRHCAYACGLGEKYESGEMDSIDFQGQSGKVKIKIDPAKGEYSAKNSVADYIVSSKQDEPKKADIDDSIPF